MRAYGELVANVAKTVDEFAQDNISENNARDWLAGKYPDAIGVTIGSDSGFADGDTPAQAPSAEVRAKGRQSRGSVCEEFPRIWTCKSQ